MSFEIEVEVDPSLAPSRSYLGHLAEEQFGGQHKTHARTKLEVGGDHRDQFGWEILEVAHVSVKMSARSEAEFSVS